MMTFDQWLMKIPGFSRSGFNRSLGRQCWEDAQKQLREENEKLKSLILLTDPSVSHIEMNTTSASQWMEFKRWAKEKGYL